MKSVGYRAWLTRLNVFGRRVAAIALDWSASILLSRVISTWLMSASSGQRLLGISVVRVDGGRVPLWQVFVRTLLICLISPAVVYDNTGRGFHDRAVGSVAIRAKRPDQRT